MNIEAVKAYYGKILQQSSDLKTEACCTPGSMPDSLKALLKNVHDEVLAKYYGCGLILPEQLQECRILDLGCGAGRDVYVLSQLAGESGEVVGVDMTMEQLATARAHCDWHRERFGYGSGNVRFVEGYIENLTGLGLEPASFDVIVSNCVINLSIDKPAVLAGAYSLLKPGGEMYFSDVYADRRLSEEVREDKVLYGECLGGALYWGDFLSLALEAGFVPARVVTSRSLGITDRQVAEKTGEARFRSTTCRLFRVEGAEPGAEDYGQAVIYQGGITDAPHVFVLDEQNRFERGRVVRVCANTVRILQQGRFAPYFAFMGEGLTHYGAFGRT